MKGYHVRQYIRPFHTLDEFEVYCQLLSVLYWKKLYGDIGLVADIMTISTLKPYGILDEYTEINTTIFDKHMPPILDKNKFWSFGKIVTAAYAPENEFCIIDTDAYFREKITLDSSYDFIGAHKELTNNKRIYPSLRNFIKYYTPEEEKAYAINTSFLYCNNPLLMQVWYRLASDVAKEVTLRHMYTTDTTTYAKFAVTVEQRFLPMIAERLGYNYTTFISNTYNPSTSGKRVQEWFPNPKTRGNIADMSKAYFHIWGLKYVMRKNLDLRHHLYNAMTHDFQTDFPTEFAKYYKAFDNLHNQFSTAWLIY